MYIETSRQILNIAKKLSAALRITGPFNIQFIAKDNKIKIIECNLRASRSFPFVSKVSGTDFIDLAMRSIMDEKIENPNKNINGYVGVKAPQFSFSRLRGADPVLGVEMSSTGEVACLGRTVEDAFLKSVIASGFNLPKKNVLVSIAKSENKSDLLDEIRQLFNNGYRIFATEHTSEFLSENGVKNTLVYKIHQKNKKPNIIDYLKNKKFDLVICIPNMANNQELEDGYAIRRSAIDFSVPLLTNKQIAKFFIKSMIKKKDSEFEIEPWDYYVK
jgi:carbamoyl-phosphate synthase large subunit